MGDYTIAPGKMFDLQQNSKGSHFFSPKSHATKINLKLKKSTASNMKSASDTQQEKQLLMKLEAYMTANTK